MRSLAIFSFVAIFALSALAGVEPAKILAVFPFPGPSQYILVKPYLYALAGRGHEVTVINTFEQKEEVKNLRVITAPKIHENYDDLIISTFEDRNHWQMLNFYNDFLKNVTVRALENKGVQQLLHSPKEKFDLLIVETLQNEALFGLAEHFNAPIIGVSSFGTDQNIDELVGNVSPLSYVPSVTGGLTDRMTFYERLQNLVEYTINWLFARLIGLPEQVEIYKKYFPNAKADLLELRKNVSLMLLNQHFTLSFPRPYVPNMVEVGGFHLNHKPAPLPTDMEAFLNASAHGVVYFSMGSNIKSKDLPKDKLEIILQAFESLKPLRVMWKFEATDLPGKPDNVFISKWFPQPDILAHPRVKLFITHGGLLSTIEAIYHGKPVLGIPMFYDQFLNVRRAKKAGFGLSLDFNTLDVKELKGTVESILNNPSFAKIASKLSQRYRDQPMAPLDTAIYWTEYVLRHKGAPHMRNAGQDLCFWAQHSLDTAAVLFGGIGLAVLLLIFVVFKVISFIFGKKSINNVKQKRH